MGELDPERFLLDNYRANLDLDESDQANPKLRELNVISTTYVAAVG
jgi:hypothetical protein